MFRLYRKTICYRWHSKYKNSIPKKSQKVQSKASVLCVNPRKQNHSDDSSKKQHADKQDKWYWDDPHFHFHFLKTSLFETAGWLGTVAVCFNYHFKHINSIIENESGRSCLFSNIVLALPRRNNKTEAILSPVPLQTFQSAKIHSTVSTPVLSETVDYNSVKEEVLEDADILGENIKVLTERFSVAVENSVGVQNIDKNDKKAFHSFQNAARHGSGAGFYNLGLCYQLGKGTRVNLNMAAYCYRRAVMKGHGLASFNLAVFFSKGIGGVPIDTKIAKELLAEAAEKNVPEAQLYFGILFLEEKKWADAVRIFSDLSKRNIPEAQYYLGLCYENGLGVQRNEKLASELFEKSANLGNKRAAEKIKNSKNTCNNNSLPFSRTNEHTIAESSSLHSSASVPELRTLVKKSSQNLLKFPILSYLDLFTPVLIANNTNKIEDSCHTDENLVKEYSSTYLSLKPLPSVVMEIKS